jgi:hypothetical protein
MYMELFCRDCDNWFIPSLTTGNEAVLEQIHENGPWSALGDGATVEDWICAELRSEAEICCPDCGQSVGLSEENLGQLSLQLLEQW